MTFIDGGNTLRTGMVRTIHDLPQPVIGAVNGVAVTGGFELLTSCDVLIGTKEARFADTHARLGLVAGWGLSQRLPRLIGFNRAKHAVIEAAILATRVHLLPHEEILAEFDRLSVPVEKTAGQAEAKAFELLRAHVQQAGGSSSAKPS